MLSGIYAITNPKGRTYVGFSTCIEKRWENYRFISNIKAQKLLYNSMKKYGYNNHVFKILEELPNDLEILSTREIYWIDKLKTYYYDNKKLGMNLTKGGNFPNKQTKPKTSEHKRKISEANKGRKHSEETKEKIRSKRKTQIMSPEHLKKLVAGNLGKPSKLKGRKRPNISNKLKGRFSPISIKCCLINTLTFEKITADSIQELSRKTNISVTSILNIRKGKVVKKYKEYIYEQYK